MCVYRRKNSAPHLPDLGLRPFQFRVFRIRRLIFSFCSPHFYFVEAPSTSFRILPHPSTCFFTAANVGHGVPPVLPIMTGSGRLGVVRTGSSVNRPGKFQPLTASFAKLHFKFSEGTEIPGSLQCKSPSVNPSAADTNPSPTQAPARRLG